MGLEFRKANESDIPLIASLADIIWHKHYPSIITIEQIEYMLKKMYSPEVLSQQMKEGQNFYLAYLDSKPVGYISISSRDGENYFIHKFYVLVDEHRKGVGTNLFNYVLNQIPQAKTIELAVNRMNYKPINFYFKLGFIIKHTFDLDIGNGFFMNDFQMIKTLRE